MNLRQTLETMSAFFTREEIPFLVVGALGLHGYGLSRATYDVDLMVGSAAQPRVVGYLESVGYRTLHASAGFSNHVHPEPERGRVDVLYVGGETEREVFAGAVRREVLPGLGLPVPRAEHLAAMKVHAMHNDPDRVLQEMGDIRYLMQLPDVDRDEIRQAFAKRGLLDRYREIERNLDAP